MESRFLAGQAHCRTNVFFDNEKIALPGIKPDQKVWNIKSEVPAIERTFLRGIRNRIRA